MKTKSIPAILFTMVISLSAWSKEAYHHAATGIIFPSDVAEHKMDAQPRVYDEAGLGESTAFHHGASTATVYIYDNNRTDLKDDPEHRIITGELSSTIGQIKRMQKAGYYDHVVVDDQGKVLGHESPFTVISVPATYDMVKSTQTGKAIEPRRTHSTTGIGIYKNHFVKIRYSINLDEVEDEQKAYENKDAFISDIRKLILEADLRRMIEGYIRTYREDPFGDGAKDALGAVFTYADKSALISITVQADQLPWIGVEDYPYGTELMGAYVVGQVDYQLSTRTFENNDDFAMKLVLQVYKRLLAKDGNARIEAMDALIAGEQG